MRCNIETTPANGSLYFIASIKRIVPGLSFVVCFTISAMGFVNP